MKATATLAQSHAPSKDRERAYLLGVLLAIMASNYIDRFALGLLLQDIKVDLHLSDTQLGLLSGIAYSIFYGLMGIPIARWADRGNRIAIIAISTFLWSAVVALFGMAGTFAQLVLLRIGAAVGEAGLVPPAHSLIADRFARAERPRAVSIFKLGAPLSLIISYLFAGWLNELVGWRMTFFLLSLPGFGLAALAWFTLKEPRCCKSAPAGNDDLVDDSPSRQEPKVERPSDLPTPSSAKEVCRTLFRNTTFRHLLLAYSVLVMFSTGISKWQPAFFIRSYGLKTAELGVWMAILLGGGTLLGTYMGGVWATRYAQRRESLQMRWMALAYTGFGLIYLGIFLSSNLYLTYTLVGIAALGGGLSTGPLFAVIQTVVPASMRAMSIAVVYLLANLVGVGLGPLAVGALSDILLPAFGNESLRYAMMALTPGYLWVSWHLWRGSKSVARDIESVPHEV